MSWLCLMCAEYTLFFMFDCWSLENNLENMHNNISHDENGFSTVRKATTKLALNN
jgi:hypothetical protein